MTGLSLQLKDLVQKVVDEERVKGRFWNSDFVVLGRDIIESLNLNSSALKAIIQKGFDDLSQIFQHLLRTMVRLDRDNEQVADLLSSVWKVVTYFLDTTLDVNKTDIENAINKIKQDYESKKAGMNDFIEKYVSDYEIKDQKVKLHFERLKQEMS